MATETVVFENVKRGKVLRVVELENGKFQPQIEIDRHVTIRLSYNTYEQALQAVQEMARK
jgi:uncharacterized protein YqfB (UPF0267 family)